MIKYNYRVAEEKDIETISRVDVKFHYIESLKTEIIGEYAFLFLWIIMEDENGFLGYARCKRINNWWIMEGLFIDKTVKDIWAAYKLTEYTIKFLEKEKMSIISWTDSPKSGKASIFLKNQFIIYPMKVYRFILYSKAIQKLMLSNSKNYKYWKRAQHSDYECIANLSKNGNSFVNNINVSYDDKVTKWMVYKANDVLTAAICWWQHDDLLDIHYTLSSDESFDCIDGLIKILKEKFSQSIKLVKVNIEEKRFNSVLRILSVQPCTYSTGCVHYVLKNNLY